MDTPQETQTPVSACADGRPETGTPPNGCASSPLTHTTPEQAAAGGWKVLAGDPNTWQTIAKASNEALGVFKSTKAMRVPGGTVFQVTTERFADGALVLAAEALTFVPDPAAFYQVFSGAAEVTLAKAEQARQKARLGKAVTGLVQSVKPKPAKPKAKGKKGGKGR